MSIGFLKKNWDLVATAAAGLTASVSALTGHYDVAATGIGATAVMCTVYHLRTAFGQRAGSLLGVGILTASLAVVGSQVTDFSNFPHPPVQVPAREVK